jgi:hypothetical protein
MKTFFIRIYLGIKAYNKFLTAGLFIRINLNPKPHINHQSENHQTL